jgi:streptogramin lyase
MFAGRLLALVVGALVCTAVAGAKGPPLPVETAVVAAGAEPCGASVARDRGLWVGVYGAGRLVRIDSATGRVTRRIRVGASACNVALGRRAAWVTRDHAATLVRVDLATGRRRAIEVGSTPIDVILAAGSLWVTSFDEGTVAQIDPSTSRTMRTYDVGPTPTGLARCGGRVWVGHAREVTWLNAIDPATRRVDRVDVGTASPREPECVRGELWVATPDTVLRLDARSGGVLGRLQLGETLATVAAGPDGLVWVTEKEHSRVYRLTADGGSIVDSFPAGPGAFALARTGSRMWVTSYAGSDVRAYAARP